MDKIPPYFHFYPDAYWGDEKAILLSYAQHGLYLFLLSHQWREGSIPSDLETLAKLSKLDGTALAALWRGLDLCFERRGDRLINPRLDRERRKLIAYFKSKSNSGKLGASALWAKELQCMAPLKRRQGGALATKAITKAKDIPPSPLFQNSKFVEAWKKWEQHRREIKKPLTKTSLEQQLRVLEKSPDPIAMIEHTIFKGWQGLREPEEKRGEGKPPSRVTDSQRAAFREAMIRDGNDPDQVR